MNLEAEEEECPCRGGKGNGEEWLARSEKDDDAWRADGQQRKEERGALQERNRVVFELDEDIESAPEIGHLVLKETAGKGKDAMDDLEKLVDVWVVPGVGIEDGVELRKERQWLHLAIQHGIHVDAMSIVVEDSEHDGEKQRSKGEKRSNRHARQSDQIHSGPDADSQEVGKDGWRIVESHLLEPQGQDKKDAGPHVSSSQNTRHAGHDETQHDGIILKVHMVNQDRRRLQQDGCQGHRRRPRIESLERGIATYKDNQRRNSNEELGNDDAGAHKDLERVIVESSRRKEGKPGGIDTATNLA